MVQTLTKWVPLKDLKADDRNPKKHDIAGTIRSLKRFGFVDPVVQDQRTGLLIAGHGRVEALKVLKERGEDPPGGIDPDGGWKVPTFVGWSSTDDDEAGAALVALNRLTERGGWDSQALTELLTAVAGSADGLSGVGYDDDELDVLRAKLGTAPEETDRLLEEQELRPFERTYFLIAAPIDYHGTVWEILGQLDELEGVDVAASQS